MSPLRTLVSLTAVAMLAATASLVTVAAVAADQEFSIGIQGHARTEAADIGLPVFAGAVPFSEGDGDKAGVTLGAWAGKFGLHLDALKFRAAAPADQVAAFYAKALGRYGDVLDCREPAARVKPPKGSDKLSCEASAPHAGDYEYRVGTAASFRVVSIKRDGAGSRFDMARIDLKF